MAPQARDIVAALTREPLVVLALATLLTWAMHSSIAAVLVIATLAQAGLVTPVAALAMVLGANLGSALNPLVNALSGEPAAIRLPLGNLINRLTGCALALPLLTGIAGLLAGVTSGPGPIVVLFHLAFNVALAALFMPALAGPRQFAGAAAARPATVGRSLDAALSRPGIPGHTGGRPRQCGAGDPADGGCRGDHAGRVARAARPG